MPIVAWQLSTVGKIAIPAIAAWYAKRKWDEWNAPALEPPRTVTWNGHTLRVPVVKLSGCMGQDEMIVRAAVHSMREVGWFPEAIAGAVSEMWEHGPEQVVRRWFDVC